MSIKGTLDPGQLAIITAVLDDYCRSAGIDQHSPERDALARRAMEIYASGVQSPGELKLALGRLQSRAP